MNSKENGRLRRELEADRRVIAEQLDLDLGQNTIPGHPLFHAILAEMGRLHAKKSADYGTDHDPLANIRAATGWGMTPLQGVLLRIGDKIQRLQSYSQNGTLANESVEDTLADLACYAVLGLVLLREVEQPSA